MYDAAMAYKKGNARWWCWAGKKYGTGSSRDWAAKGSNLLGVRAVITQSFERIHRSNLVGMGVLPLVFKEGESVAGLGLNGEEIFTITGIARYAAAEDAAGQGGKDRRHDHHLRGIGPARFRRRS